MTQNYVIVSFYSSFSQFVNSLWTIGVSFPASVGESILGRESTDVIFCFYFLSSPFMLHSFPLTSLSFCIHVPFISFHFAFMSFHVPSLCIKDTGLRKLICSNRSGGHPPKRSRFVFFIFCYRFCYRLAIVLEACAGCHLQAS